MTRGSLRIYLGAAPGVGKTFAMLGEGRRRAERGTDVVVGFLEAHGNVYAPETLDVALANYFRVGNLAALRELSLLWVADRVDEALLRYRAVHGVRRPWETRERVVVALTGAPGGEALIRRAARMAARAKADLIGVHVHTEDGLRGPPTDRLSAHRELLEEFGGTYHEIRSSDVAGALVGLARTENATQLVLGASLRSRLSELTRGSVINEVIRQSGSIDVHVVSREDAPAGPRLPRMPVPAGRRRSSPLPPRPRPPPRRRRQAACALAVAGAPLQGAAMVPLRQHLQLSSVLLLFLLQVVAAAALGGPGPALAAATLGFLLPIWYFTPPLHQWTIGEPQSLIALLVYLVVAGVVSWFVATVARRSAEVARARAEAETLARVAAASADEDPLGPLARQLLVAFGQQGVAVLRRGGGPAAG